MKVCIVEIDKNNDDNWELFGVFSSEEKADEKLKEKGITSNCSSITIMNIDEAV